MKYINPLILILVFPLSLAAQSYSANFDVHFNVNSVIELEQNDESIIIYPMYYIDRNGNILTADIRLNQVKVFNENGSFIKKFGREGRGPGEFTNLISAIRLQNENILAADVSGRLTLFSADGVDILDTYKTSIIPLMRIHELNNDQVLLFGRGGTDDVSDLIHLLDLKSKEITESFLEFNLQNHSQILRILTNISAAAISRDQIITAITPFKKFCFYGLKDFNLNGSQDFTLQNFESIEDQNIVDNNLSMTDITKFSWIESMYAVGNDNVLIQYVRWLTMPPPGSNEWRETKYSLALVNLEGELLFEIPDSPKLIHYNQESNLFYFIDILSEKEEYNFTSIKTATLN